MPRSGGVVEPGPFGVEPDVPVVGPVHIRRSRNVARVSVRGVAPDGNGHIVGAVPRSERFEALIEEPAVGGSRWGDPVERPRIGGWGDV